MIVRGGRARSARSLLLFTLVCAVACTACNRAAASSLLPLLQLGVAAERVAASRDDSTARSTGQQRWGAVLFVSLRFQPQIAAAQVPTRAELAPETWVLPCDADDVICLQEALELERDLVHSVGDLQ